MSTKSFWIVPFVVLSLVPSGIAGSPPSHDFQVPWALFLDLPDPSGQLHRTKLGNLPGEPLYAREEVTGIRIPVYTAEQATKIALLLASYESSAVLPFVISGMTEPLEGEPSPANPGDQLFNAAGKTRLCLVLPSRSRPVEVALDGEARVATREGDNTRLLLFTESQSRQLIETLRSKRWPLHEIAAVLAGFELDESTSSTAAAPVPLAPGCGKCQTGRVCTTKGPEGEPIENCCTSGTATCRACAVCTRGIDIDVLSSSAP
jgi:hypothetical protein